MTTNGISIGAAFQYDLLDRPTYTGPKWVNVQGMRYEYDGGFLKKVCRGLFSQGGPCSISVINDVAYDGLGRRSIVSLPQGNRTYTYASNDTRHLKKDELGLTKIEYTQHDPLGNVVAWATQSSIGGVTNGTFAYDTRNRLGVSA